MVVDLVDRCRRRGCGVSGQRARAAHVPGNDHAPRRRPESRLEPHEGQRRGEPSPRLDVRRTDPDSARVGERGGAVGASDVVEPVGGSGSCGRRQRQHPVDHRRCACTLSRSGRRHRKRRSGSRHGAKPRTSSGHRLAAAGVHPHAIAGTPNLDQERGEAHLEVAHILRLTHRHRGTRIRSDGGSAREAL